MHVCTHDMHLMHHASHISCITLLMHHASCIMVLHKTGAQRGIVSFQVSCPLRSLVLYLLSSFSFIAGGACVAMPIQVYAYRLSTAMVIHVYAYGLCMHIGYGLVWLSTRSLVSPSYHVLSCLVMHLVIMSYHVLSCRIMSYHVLSCLIMSHHVSSCLIMHLLRADELKQQFHRLYSSIQMLCHTKQK